MICHLEGEYPYLGDLLTMVINHLLTGMILQVCPNPSLPKSSSHTLWGSVWKDPLKTEPQEVFVGPNTDPHKVFGRLGSDDMHKKITDPLPSALKTLNAMWLSHQRREH